MKTKRKITTLFFPSLMILILAAFASAETVNCTAITTVPYTITTQGVYCLTGAYHRGHPCYLCRNICL